MSGCTGICGRLEARMVANAWEPPYYERLKMDLLGSLQGEVLEIGPGSGVNLKYYQPSVRWTGIEPNVFLHGRIRHRAARAGFPARLLSTSAEQLDLPDESVDAVVGTLVLCSVADPDAVLKEIVRVLKPGGRYVFIEHVAAPRGTGTRRLQEIVAPVMRRLPGGCSPNRETESAIERAGFRTVVRETFEIPVAFGLAVPHIAGTATK